jgi:hypothetical protein
MNIISFKLDNFLYDLALGMFLVLLNSAEVKAVKPSDEI